MEEQITEASLKYDKKNTFPVDFEWNSSKSRCFGAYMNDIGKARIAFTLETMYFGTPDNVFIAEKAVECGRCFARAVKEYDKDEVKITFTGDLMCKEQMTKASDGNYDKIFDGVKSALADSDYLVGNLETPVAGEAFGLTNEMYFFNTPESYLASLKKYGFRLIGEEHGVGVCCNMQCGKVRADRLHKFVFLNVVNGNAFVAYIRKEKFVIRKRNIFGVV